MAIKCWRCGEEIYELDTQDIPDSKKKEILHKMVAGLGCPDCEDIPQEKIDTFRIYFEGMMREEGEDGI